MWWVAAGTQNLLQCTPNINKQCLLSSRLQKKENKKRFLICLTSRLEPDHESSFYWQKTLNLIRKQQAEWGLSMTERAAASQTLFWANSCNKHTRNSTVQPHSHCFFCFFFVIVLYRPRLWRRPFLQADISLKRYCPWKIWPFIVMLTQINDPKIHNSLTETVYGYIQYVKHIWETE